MRIRFGAWRRPRNSALYDQEICSGATKPKLAGRIEHLEAAV